MQAVDRRGRAVDVRVTVTSLDHDESQSAGALLMMDVVGPAERGTMEA